MQNEQYKTDESAGRNSSVSKVLKQPPPLLKNFHFEDLHAFLKTGEVLHFSEGEVVVRESRYENSAYLIAEGKTSVWKDNIQVALLSEGDFIGETFLYSKNVRIAKIVAHTDCVLLRFERPDILNFFRERPAKLFNIFTRNIIELQQKKVENMNMQLVRLMQMLLENKSV